MKFSLITVTFNSGQTIRNTFDSVLKQTYSDFEYILVDGSSKDNTLDLINEYVLKFNERLRWISEKDDGLYDAMNKGFSMATGDVIGIINSDDVLADPAAIEKVVKCFERVKRLMLFMLICIMLHKTIYQRLCVIGCQVNKGVLPKAGILHIPRSM